jgi:hypothetical protein
MRTLVQLVVGLLLLLTYSASFSATLLDNKAKPNNETVSQIVINGNASPILCFGGNDGFIDITVTGGTEPYSYEWSNNQNTEDIFFLPIGNYSVTVTDINNVVATASFTVNGPAEVIQLSGFTLNATCYNGNDGGISMTTTGGTAPYSWIWNDGSTTEDRTGLPAGDYFVVVTDFDGNCSQKNFAIGQSPMIEANQQIIQNTCSGGHDAAISLYPNQGFEPYSFNWATGETNSQITDLSAGYYYVTITDANNCSMDYAFEIIDPVQIINVVGSTTNISCFGLSNGSIDLNVSGGTEPYSYNWTNGQSSEDLTGLFAGNYAVMVSDNNSCTKAYFVINEPDQLSISGITANPGCNWAANGSIDITVTGGVEPYAYAWDNGSFSEDQASLIAGIYAVEVTDANGCSVLMSFELTQPNQLQLNYSLTNISCYGGHNGAVNLTLAGGTLPYSYFWSNGSNSEDISNLYSGEYAVTVIDANGCTANGGPFILSQPSQLVIQDSVVMISCHGASDGKIFINPQGGSPVYYYNWSDWATSRNRFDLNINQYTVTVTDSHGCHVSKSYIITQPTTLFATSQTTNVSCYGMDNGTITMNTLGGSSPYSYMWSDGNTSEDRLNVTAGQYTVTITDANNCQQVYIFNITQPDSLYLEFASSNISCQGANNGSIDVTVHGGTSPFQYLWNDGINTEDRGGLPYGIYSLTISDVNGCSAVNQAIIIEPTALLASGTTTNIGCFGASTGGVQLNVQGGTLPYSYLWSNGSTQFTLDNAAAGSYSVSITDVNGCIVNLNFILTQPSEIIVTESISLVTCNGSGDGEINLSLSGGFAPYSYLWNDGNTNEDRSGLTPGLYTISVTDNHGCVVSENYEITQPDLLVNTAITTNISCNGLIDGQIDLDVSGGTLPYLFSWSNASVSEDLTNLGTGTYSVTITDASGCQSEGSYSITQPDQLALTSSQNEITCFNGTNGSIDLTVAGGTSPYTYLWSNNATTEDLADLLHGSYSVTVTDANNCSQIHVATLVNPLEVVTLTSVQGAVSCPQGNDGYVDITLTNGTAPFTFSWSNGTTNEDLTGVSVGLYSLTVTDAGNFCSMFSFNVIQIPALQISASLTNITCNSGNNGEINTTVTGGTAPYDFLWSNGSTDEDPANLLAGSYVVTVTDANQCTISSDWVLTEPDAISLTESISAVSCNGGTDGSIDITASGGNPDYQYLWSTGSTSSFIENLIAGDYMVSVTDVSLCLSVSTFTVTEPALITPSSSVSGAGCFGGTDGAIDLTVSGGTAPYTFAWSNGSSSEDIDQLIAGSYSVTITDNNLCSTDYTVVVSEPGQLIDITTVISLVSCPGGNNGAINIEVTGGVLPYAYIWSNGETSEDISPLSAGTYVVTVSDFNGSCSVFSIILGEVDPILITPYITNAICNGSADGAIDISVDYGNPPYSYLWSNGDVNEDISGILAGDYEVTVTDFAGCTEYAIFTITEPESILPNGTVVNTTCFGSGSGSIDLEPTGGNGNYSYSWSNGGDLRTIENLLAGSYSVTVYDDLGCSGSATFIVEEFSDLTGIISNSYQQLTCSGNNIDPIEFIPDNYLPEEVTYTWVRNYPLQITGMPISGSSPALGALINNTSFPITVMFTITPSFNGCPGIPYQAFVAVPTAFTATATFDPLLCNGGTTTVFVTGAGGTTPYQPTTSFTTTAGYHEFSIEDFNGCVATAAINISQPDPISISSVITNNICQYGTNGGITLTVNGGTGPYTFLWNDGNTNQNRFGLQSGAYTVTVTDANGCEATHTTSIFWSHITATAFMTTELTACEGVPHLFTVYLTGTKPFMLQYTNFDDTITVLNINSFQYDFYANLSQNAQYKLLFVADIVCAGNVYGGVYNIQTHPQPTGLIQPHNPVCPNTPVQLQVDLTGQAPWSITWNDGSSHTVNNIMQSPYFIDVIATSTKTYTLTSAQDAFCNATSLGTPVTLNVFTPPTATITGTTAICEGVAVNLVVYLTGAGPWTLVINNESHDTTISGITTSPFYYTITPHFSAIYTIVSVTDSHCTAIGTGAATVTVRPRPYAHFSGPSHTCLGQASDLFINFSGTPPYQLAWTDGLTTHTLTNITNPHYLISVGADTTSNYYLTFLSDFYCNAINPSDTFLLNIAPAPTAQLSGPTTSCFGLGTDISVNLTGTAPWTIAWNDTTTHIVTGIFDNPYDIHIDPSTEMNYWITQVSDALCNGNSVGLPLNIQVIPTANVEVSGIQAINQICSGGSVSINLVFSNAFPPFTVAFQNEDGNEIQISGITQDTTIELFAPADAGSYNYSFLYVSDLNSCTHYYNIPFTIEVLEHPYVFAGLDVLLEYGQNITMSPVVSGGTAPYSYNWTPGTFLSDSTIIDPVCQPAHSETYILAVTDLNGCSNTDTVVVGVNVTRTVLGTITYNNDPSTPLNNVIVYAIKGTDTIASSTTNQFGAYDFSNLPDGTYHLGYRCNKLLGGVNATDALLILRHFVQLAQLSGLRKICSDVDNSQYINSADALYVSKRFTGQITSFIVGDWIFDNVSFTIPALDPLHNIKGICSGDANGSNIPALKAEPKISIENLGTMLIEPNKAFSFPVMIKDRTESNALSLVLNYPQNLTITGVETPGMTDAQYAIANGELRLSWYSLVPQVFNAGDPIVILHALSPNSVLNNDLFSVTGESEFADIFAESIENTTLQYPKLQLDAGQTINTYVYPNPANDKVGINLNLPEEGKVTVWITNSIGEQINVISNQAMEAGNHNINFSTEALAPGMYTCTIQYNTSTNLKLTANRFIIAR